MKFFSILSFVLTCATAVGGSLTARSYHLIFSQSLAEDRPDSETLKVQGSLIIKNEGRDRVKIPTEFLGPKIVMAPPEKLMIQFRYAARVIEDICIIPAESKFAPVLLDAGDSAELIFEFEIPRNRSIGQIKVAYEIPESLAERFGFWAGTLETTSAPRRR